MAEIGFDFYSFEGPLALRDKLRDWEAANWWCISPKCRSNARSPCSSLPSRDFFKHKTHARQSGDYLCYSAQRRLYQTRATETLEHLLEDKQIAIESDFAIEKVDNDKEIVDYGGRPFPLTCW